jgi:predicted anti-sigma-YlaC factor YlaD
VTRFIICDRVRAQISLELDAGLSQVERAMLRKHLDRCPECRSFDAAARAFTTELREAALERPSRPVVVSRPARSRAGRARGVFAQVGAAAIVLIGVVGLTGPAARSDLESDRTSSPVTDLFESSWTPAEEQAQLFGGGGEPRRPPGIPGSLSAI